MIRTANKADIDALMKITAACANHMIAKGIYQWNEHYPSRQAFIEDLERDELYVLEISGELIGCITISTLKDEEYVPIEWLTPDGKNYYIHRLAVHPKMQGHGYAQHLMDHAEIKAKAKGFASIRLDTFSQNKRNQLFYELRGYKRLGNIHFPKQSDHPFYCYELVL